MKRLGLALSGGGFRATLYHLGVLRFLRDAGALNRISHITSVSGGSIIAAHLVMNWDRYTGSEEEFDQASEELLSFIRMDVRNRIVRRFPLAALANRVRWAFGRGTSRRLTRPGLLEMHYEKHLFGDKCLYELPPSPQLHILATNVNEGCLCSFTRRGMLVQHRLPDGQTRFEPVPSALATLPIAVTASSAFPGFFPPLLLTAQDVGAQESQFPPHVFTDGGVYDNLGVRMFRYIQKSWMKHESPLRPDDIVEPTAVASAFENALENDSHASIKRLAQLIQKRSVSPDIPITEERLSQALWNVIDLDRLYEDDNFDQLTFARPQANDLIHLVQRGRTLDRGDHLWLNRCIASAAYREATGKELLNSVETEFDAIIVSDAGKQFSVSRRTKGGGLIGAAMRSSDIVMDRVWRLECDHFRAEPDFVFAPMKTIVHLADDPHALHPEIQNQVTNARTDLDKFSELEMSGLIRHGYSVMRKIAQSRKELFGNDLPSGPPWDPTAISNEIPSAEDSPSQITSQARELQKSSQRQIFGRLLNWRDWPTYIYLPLLLALLIGLPFFAFKQYRISHRSELIVDAITFSNPDFQLVLQLAQQNPAPGDWESLEVQEVPTLEPTDFSGFRLVTDTRVLDARAWNPETSSQENQIVAYRRMLVRRVSSDVELGSTTEQPRSKFRIQQFDPTANARIRSSSKILSPTVRRAPHVQPSGKAGFMYETEFDLSFVPAGDDFQIDFETSTTGIQGREDRRSRLLFPIVAPTDVATMWVLLPEGIPYRDVEIVAFQDNQTGPAKVVTPTYRFDMSDGSLFGWMLVAPGDDFTYECRWSVDFE